MDGRIFQLSNKKINEDDFIAQEDFYESDFMGAVADNVYGNIEKEKDIKCLFKRLKPFGIITNEAEKSIIFTRGFKKRYFKEKFEEFKKMAENITIDEFIDPSTIYKLTKLIKNRLDYYICIDDYLQALDDFVRRSLQEEQKYFIGGIVGYHAPELDFIVNYHLLHY